MNEERRTQLGRDLEEAFTELAAQAYEKALGLLQMLQDTLIERNGGHSDVSPWDVPGMAVFWSEESGVLEELPETPLRLLEAAIPHADVNGQATLAFFVDRFRLTNEAMR